MIDWWNSLDLFMKIMWAITLAASLIFVIQTILTFIGAGGSDFDTDASGLDLGGMDASADDASGAFDSDPSMNLLTFRNFINFCLGFGWASVLLHDKISSTSLLLIIAVIIGIALVAAVMMLFKWLSGMQQAGNINVYRSAVGCKGTKKSANTPSCPYPLCVILYIINTSVGPCGNIMAHPHKKKGRPESPPP